MRYYNHSTELYHHGIKGQKWGIRRFQNKDGSLTKAGEKRYSEESDKKIQINHDGSKIIPVGLTLINQVVYMLVTERKMLLVI